jgi:lipopolysaccharide transport system permease protein
VLFSVGLGLCLGVLNVFFRDVGAFFAIALQFWFWLTPIVYPASILPEWAGFWMDINPMAPLIESFQQVVVAQAAPDPARLVLPAVVGGLLCLLGLHLLRQHAAELVDEL